MTRWRARNLQFDGLLLIASFFFFLYILMSLAWIKRYNPGHLLWFCDIALLLTATGLFLRSGFLVATQLTAIIAFHLIWNLDFWLILLFSYAPVGSTGYMFYSDITLAEKSFSFFSHTFVIPAALYGISILGAPSRAWLAQWGQTCVVFVLTYLLTNPEENVNRMFGVEIFNFSLTKLSILLYYTLMVTVPPLLIYWPTNKLLTIVVKYWQRGKTPASSYSLNSAPYETVSYPFQMSWSIITAIVFLAAAFSVAISYAADRKYALGQDVFQIAPHGKAALEAMSDSMMRTSVDRLMFGEGETARQAPLLVWPSSELPKQWSGFDRKLHPHTKSTLLKFTAEAIPSVPQEVTLGGTRSVPGSVVWAYVASDDFYLQSQCDLRGERRNYEVVCQIGGRGVSEYVDPETGELYVSTATNEILGNGTGAIYALGTIEVSKGRIVAKSPYYIVKRRGIRFPEDVWFIARDGALVPLLSQSNNPAGARVSFQSPFNAASGVPDIFISNFFGHRVRNLTNTPERFDGFVQANGQAFAGVGWVNSSVIRYYTDNGGKLMPFEILAK